MENASRALLIAASVLLGVMILSVATALFSSFSSSGREIVEKMDERQLSEWNNNYLKYVNTNEITAHDIITVINHAQENNKKYFEGNMPNGYDENTYYVQVDIGTNKNVEKWNEQRKNNFLKNNLLVTDENSEYYNYTKYFSCEDTDYKISQVTKRVIYIKFKE